MDNFTETTLSADKEITDLANHLDFSNSTNQPPDVIPAKRVFEKILFDIDDDENFDENSLMSSEEGKKALAGLMALRFINNYKKLHSELGDEIRNDIPVVGNFVYITFTDMLQKLMNNELDMPLAE